jgi:uncharacterized protein YegP (UPF0339 family)
MKFEVYEDNKGEWRWRLFADNGQIIAVPGEGYVAKVNCLANIALVKAAGMGNVPVEMFGGGRA